MLYWERVLSTDSSFLQGNITALTLPRTVLDRAGSENRAADVLVRTVRTSRTQGLMRATGRNRTDRAIGTRTDDQIEGSRLTSLLTPVRSRAHGLGWLGLKFIP